MRFIIPEKRFAGNRPSSRITGTFLAKGLFHRAIGQSGGGFGAMAYLQKERAGLPAAEKTGTALAEALGGGGAPLTLNELRAVSADQLLNVFEKELRARPQLNVDGWVFPEPIQKVFENGKQNSVSVILGSNADEGTSMFAAATPMTIEQWRQQVQRRYGESAEEFQRIYPAENQSQIREAMLASLTDEWFGCQMQKWAELTPTVDATAYLYYFTRVPPDPGERAVRRVPWSRAHLLWAICILRLLHQSLSISSSRKQ
jgi:para-nitrobenzyl esterase